ncbi:MAG: hypothetical protein PVJ76_07630 [Gemmatimonadota bacterium]|jgi:hypothetical protein
MTVPQGPRAFLAKAQVALDDNNLPIYLKTALAQALLEIQELEAKADDLKNQLERLAPLSWRPIAPASPTRSRPGPFVPPRIEAITLLPSPSPIASPALPGVCGETNAPSNGVLPKRRTPAETSSRAVFT